MFKNLRVQKLGVGFHVVDDNMQHVIALARDGETLGHLGQQANMRFEVQAILIAVLGHCDQQQYLDIEASQFRVKQRDLALDQAGLLKIPHTSPARGPGHAGFLGQIGLIASNITLQGFE